MNNKEVTDAKLGGQIVVVICIAVLGLLIFKYLILPLFN